MDKSIPTMASTSSNKLPPKDMSHHYSHLTKARQPSDMKRFYKYFMIPGIGQLAGGLPNSSYFPFDTLEAQTARPERWTPTPNHPGDDSELAGLSSKVAKAVIKDRQSAAHVVVPHDAATADPVKKIDLTSALQYGQADGYPPLLSYIKQFAREVLHPNVPYEGGLDAVLTVGSTDGMAKTLDVFTNIWVEGKDDIRERPGLMTEVYMYANVLAQAKPRGINMVPIEIDEFGMVPYGPGSLEDVLSNWDDSTGKRPHLIYSVTIGHNPTGSVQPLERRREIYEICCKYDVIIIEDDPYWYLQFPSAEVEEAKARGLPIPEPKVANTLEKKSGYPFIDSLVPSYLNIDTEGRVVRLDTFSKTVAPGCRLGWVTSTPEICSRITRVSETGTQQPSGFVQAMIAEAIMGPQVEAAAAFASRSARDKASFTGWQTEGWVRWLAGLRGEYERRMYTMASILEEGRFQLKQSTPLRDADSDWGVITKTKLYDFHWPAGGMFLWITVNFPEHPLWHATGSHGNIIGGPLMSMALMVFMTLKPQLVLLAPGTMFSVNDEIRNERGWACFRACFAAETSENIAASSRRFAEGVQRFWRIKKVQDLEKLLQDGLAASEEPNPGLANFGVWMGC